MAHSEFIATPPSGRGNKPMSVASLLRSVDAPSPDDLPGPYSEIAFCEAHGAYMISTVDEHHVRRARPAYCARCERQRQLEKKLARAAFPARFREASFRNYDVTCEGEADALAAAREYAQPFKATLRDGRNLLLLGSNGTGKTRLACSVAREVIAQGYTALYITVRDFLGMVSAVWDQKSMTEEALFATLTEPDLLILDEVGPTRSSEHERVLLNDLIDRRSRELKPMIVAGNVKVRELRDRIGERALDRLREGGSKAIQFRWGSRRTSRKHDSEQFSI